jgi:serine/threonine protein kinase
MGATFNSVAATMTEFIKDDLPERWQEKFKTIDSDWFEESANELQKWLEEIYFDDRKRQIFTRQDIVKIGDLVRRLLRFEPSARASVDEILQDPWFKDENWEELLRPKSEEPPRPQSKDLLSPKSEELLKPKGDVEESKSEEVSKPQVVSVIGKVRP